MRKKLQKTTMLGAIASMLFTSALPGSMYAQELSAVTGSASYATAPNGHAAAMQQRAYEPFKRMEAQPESGETSEFRPDRILIKLKGSSEDGGFSAQSIDNPLWDYGIKGMVPIELRKQSSGFSIQSIDESVPQGKWYRAELEEGVDVLQTVKALEGEASVLAAEPDYLRKIEDLGIPDLTTDPQISDEWYLEQLGIKQSWEYLKQQGIDSGGTRDIIVAVIDTGVDYNHPDLKGNMWINTGEIPGNGYDDDHNGYIDDIHGASTVGNQYAGESGDPMDDHGHGTHVAGIIAAQAHNLTGGAGVAHNVQIMAIKAAQSGGVLASSDISEAILYAVDKGADVINMSFGGYGRSTLEEDALQIAFGTSIPVAAAGNDGKPNDPHPLGRNMYPADYNWVLGVMAESQTPAPNGDYLAGFSNWDFNPQDSHEYEVMAPGVEIFSTLPGGNYAKWSGTSMATPVVSGIAALVRSKFSNKDTFSSRFIMGQIAATGTLKQGKTYAYNEPPIFYKEVNAYNALTDTPKPKLSYLEHYILDKKEISPANDGDGVIDAGETVDIAMVIRNHWGKADNVQVKLDTKSPAEIDDPYVTFITDTVDYGAVGTFNIDDNGLIYENDVITGVQNPFRIKVADQIPNDHMIPIHLSVTGMNGLDPMDKSVYSYDGGFNLFARNGKELPPVIKQDMTLTRDHYWILPNATVIERGATVRVEPGTQIQFWSSEPEDPYAEKSLAYLEVRGKLLVNGTAEEPVELFASSIFPGYEVKIYNTNSGYSELNYAKVMNPVLQVSKVDHSYFTQDLFHTIYGRNLAGGEVQDYNKEPSISAATISNSRFYQLGGQWDWQKLRVDGKIKGNLFDSNHMYFDDAWAEDNVFLKNYKLEGTQYGNRNYWMSRAENFGTSIHPNQALQSVFPVKNNENGSTYFALRANIPFGGFEQMKKVQEFAQSLGGHIVTIDDSEENEFIRNYMNLYLNNETSFREKYPDYYYYSFSQDPIIGLNDFDQEGRFVWTNGDPVGYANWQSGEPNNNYNNGASTESFVRMNRYGGGWYDYAYPEGPYIIEVPGISYVTGITLDPPALTLGAGGDTAKLAPIILPARAVNKKVTWVSSDPAIAAVDENGNVTPLKKGTAQITAVTEDGGFTASSEIRVIDIIHTTGIRLNKFALELSQGAEETLIATLLPENTTNRQVIWTSNNPAVAAVDENGRVRGLSKGTTVIRATAKDGGFYAECTVSVVVPVTGIKLDKSFLRLVAGEAPTVLQPILQPIDATIRDVTWATSNASVATVDGNGAVTPVGMGTALITATTANGGFTATATVTVWDEAVSFVTSKVSAGSGHSAALNNDGTVWTWGSNQNGQLGDGTNNHRSTPVQVRNLSDVKSVSAGGSHTVALKQDGTVWSWGGGYYYNSQTPQQVPNMSNVSEISAGQSHTLALKTDGTVWAWGSNYEGQLGDGTTTSRSDPVQVEGLTDIKEISAGSNHSVALKKDGTVWAWGYNGNGKLGDGTTTNSSVPVKVANLTNVASISAGIEFTLALKTDGTVWNWGYTYWAGNNITPAPVQNLADVAAVDVGQMHAVALKKDGTVWTWGYNEQGQLGNGTTGWGTGTPAMVADLSQAVAVSAAENHTLAVKSDGTIWAWGRNDNGKLGDFTTTNRLTPVQTLFGIIPDTAPPEVVSTTPKNGATGIPKNTTITVAFDEAILQGTNFGLIKVKDSNGNTLSLKSKSIRSNILTIELLNELSGGYYYIEIPNQAVKDMFNNVRHSVYSFSFTPDIVNVSGISLDQTFLHLFTKDKPTTLHAAVSPVNASNTKVVWQSSNTSVATVDTNGTVTAVGVGSAVITATTEDGGYTASCDLEVSEFIPVTGVSLDSTALDLIIGEERVLQANVMPTTATNKALSWSSSNSAVASVDGSGKVIARSEGAAAITVASEDGGFAAQLNVTVARMPVSGISLNKATAQMVKGAEELLYAAVQPYNATNKSVRWSSSDPTIVSVSQDGRLRAVSVGTATVTATTDDGSFSAECTVTVVVGVTGVSTSKNFLRLVLGDAPTSLTATVQPGDASNKNVKWATSNNSIANVSETGTVTPVGVGTALITATTDDGGFKATTIVTVWENAVNFVTTKVEGGFEHSLAINNDGTVWAWGKNEYGRLGDGTEINRSTPVQVVNLSDVKEVAAGDRHSVALKNDGTVWNWGYVNGYNYTPSQVQDITDIVDIAAGYEYSVALNQDGSVWTWGENWNGQLGDGTTLSRWIPAQIPNLTDVAVIEAGRQHVIALKNDGTVWTWGANLNGQLGDGTTLNHASPAQVPGLTGIIAIAAGNYHSIALKSDGTVWEWGYWRTGNSTLPVQLQGISNVKEVAAGDEHGLALKNDGTVWSWGNNEYGQLGRGSPDWGQDPGQVTGLTNAVSVSAGYYHSFAVKADGSIAAWGYNGSGQLGNMATVNSPVPVQTLFGILPDNAGPIVTQTTPSANQTGVAISSSITLTFDEAVQPGDYYSLITLKDQTGKNVSLKTKKTDSNKLILEPLNPMESNKTYTVRVPNNALKDMFNNGFSSDYFLSFSTGATAILAAAGIASDGKIVLTQEEIDEARTRYFESGTLTTIKNNAFLNRWWDPNVENWMRFTAGTGESKRYLAGNFWGMTSDFLIEKALIHFQDFRSMEEIIYKPILTQAPETAYPFVSDIAVSTEQQERAETVGAETVTVNVYFNRDMNQQIQPQVSFGPDHPTTDYTVHGVDGGWAGPRHWMGRINITPLTGDGYQFFRVAGAVAADDPWLVTGNDTERFRFEIITSGTEAMNLQASGSEGKVVLTWTQDDFELLAGYNLYRSDTADGTYVKINSAVIPAEQKSYEDKNVQPGKPYFYKFTVLKTDLTESDYSNVAYATPLDTVAPVIIHEPIRGANVSAPLQFYADVTDNVKVKSVQLHYRKTGTTAYNMRELQLTANNRYSVNLEGSLVQVPGLDYYLEATDGVSIVRSGRPDQPYRIAITDAPKITSVSPAAGSEKGGTEVILTGVNFKDNASVTFGGAAATNVIVESSTRIKAVTPEHFPAVVDITVTNTDGYKDTYLRAFTYRMEGVEASIANVTGNKGDVLEVPVSVTEVAGLRSVDLQVSFDPEVLAVKGIRQGSLMAQASLITNMQTPGRIAISMASGSAASGMGSLAIIEFEVLSSTTKTSSVLALEDARLNSGTIIVRKTNGSFTLSDTYRISGEVRYYRNNKAVPGVNLTLVGQQQSYTSTADPYGYYSLIGITAGDYKLAASKSDGASNITSYDASLILQASAGLLTLDHDQRVAADVDNSGVVDAMDASYVLEKAVGLMPGPFPGSGKVWAFAPSEKQYAGLNQNYSGQSFTAILIGDVSGNWGTAADTGIQSAAAGQRFTLGAARTTVGDMAILPLMVESAATDLYSADIWIQYDPSVIEPVSIVKSDLTQNFSMALNTTEPGKIRIALAGSSPLAGGAGKLLDITFRSAGSSGTTTDIKLNSLQVNEWSVQSVQNGQVLVTQPGDFDANNTVNHADVDSGVENYGTKEWDKDLNHDGILDLLDVTKILKRMRK